MWWKLQEDLTAEATKQLKDFERYAKRVHDENARRKRRSTANPRMLTIDRPAIWALDRGFDPFYVRARADSISHSVTDALRNGYYTPHRPAGFRVPKADGSQRLVSAFPIVDELISNRLYRSLLEKNRPRFSARSYAYRSDLSAHDALMHIQYELAQEQRVFVAEYDFSKFFDRISHNHIWQTIDEMGLIRTRLEDRLLHVFLTAPAAYETRQQKLQAAEPRTEGVPQGSSISLLLANIAAVPLDRALERLDVGFVRYADDTLVWSRDYAAICEAVQILHAESDRIGSPINLEKSNGVRILVPPGTRQVEFSSTTNIEYLGHSIGLRSLTMKPSVVAKIKNHVQNLLFSNLIREPLSATQESQRIRGGLDRDYITFVWQLRRYLYGPLSEQQVRRFQNGQIPPMSFEGLMSFFPLVDDDEVLLDLDQWVSTQTWLAVRKRSRLLQSMLAGATPKVWGFSREELIGYRDISTSTGSAIDLRLPSVRRIAGVVRKAIQIYGSGVVGNGARLYMYET